MHYRDLRELSFEHFQRRFTDAAKRGKLWDWIHFEGRNTETVLRCVQLVDSHNSNCSDPSQHVTISIELEKPQRPLEIIVPYADVVFMSKDFARSRGAGKTKDEAMAALCRGMFGTIKPGSETLTLTKLEPTIFFVERCGSQLRMGQ
eukprot:c17776_g1_i2.p1 GENE.c17776_g1_i2~~c17776_g1_i2.p1  ORF type:complete len:147 (+),score=21.73 c17776_g1_i2:164-604(+)